MRIRLEGPVQAGSVRIGVLSETTISKAGSRRGIFLSAWKRPVAVLVAQDGVVTGMDLDGHPLSSGQIDRMLPEARVLMRE